MQAGVIFDNYKHISVAYLLLSQNIRFRCNTFTLLIESVLAF